MDNRITYLYNRYLSKSLSDEELREFKELISDPNQNSKINNLIDKDWDQLNEETLINIPEHTRENVFEYVVSQPQYNNSTQKSLWPRIAAAASILLFLSIGGYFLLHKKQPIQQIAQNQKHDIAPGGNKAILTLAGGKQIILNAAQNGRLAQQGNTIINKTADGEVSYQAGKENKVIAITYNDLYVPKSGQIWVTLPDGSRAMLNSDSHLHYPTAFTGNERVVELIGEAYFEVSPNAKQPFKVIVSGQTVEDIGTHFNINAYGDEPAIKTTLLEGVVSVKLSNAKEIILKPGQQAVIQQGQLSVTEPDLDEVMAWKNGMFRFSDESLESIMRKISRWYDVDIEYADQDVKNLIIKGGIITRFSNVSKVLRMLELTRVVHFKIEGKKIIVEK